MRNRSLDASWHGQGNSGTALTDPLRNKGTGYSPEEREHLALDGLLPPSVESLDQQVARVLAMVRSEPTALGRYRYLAHLYAENQTLFYAVIVPHLEELLPIIYTPTVGEACLAWSRIYERPWGLYVSATRHRGRIREVLRNWPHRAVRMIVVTDGGRILGLGDLGANGMGIPIGKLALYTACAGVPPGQCLPVMLDVGCDTASIRTEPLYLGDRVSRLSGASYDAVLDEFVAATQDLFPGAAVQFEDFNNATAFRLLERYGDAICCFNDDIQGTGAMGVAGLHAAGRVTGIPLADQRLLFVGAGEACLGIGRLVVSALKREGVSALDARRRCLFVDSHGLVVTSRTDLSAHKRPFAQDRPPVADLEAVIEDFRPTVLIGACGQGGRFTAPVLRAMARVNARPIVFALSNPTSKTECTARDAYEWTHGRVVFASGSPFAPVTVDGRVMTPGQANNSCVFPGVGLGLLAAGARCVTDEMWLAAADALAAQVTDEDRRSGRVFPPATRLRDVALSVATAVAEVAFEQGRATVPRPDDMSAAVAAAMYRPTYSSA